MTPPPSQRAWAVWDSRSASVLVPTISETATAARVNWLCIYAGLTVYAGTPDHCIADAFAQMTELTPGTVLVEVEINVPKNGGWFQ